MASIEIKNLNKTFINNKVKNHILKDINLHVDNKDIYGIIGLSGEGKSTLVRCINRLEIADENSSIIFKDNNGNEIDITNLKKGKPLQNYRKKVAMIFQSFNLMKQANVYDNIAFPLKIDKVSKDIIDLKVKKIAKFVGLEDKLDCYPDTLSGGQQQRVAIARALINEPEVLLCDEATSALDPNTANQILDLLKKLNKTLGLTMIIIAHQMQVIERVCNKVAILSDKQIVEKGDIAEIFLNPKEEITKNLIYSSHVTTRLHENKLFKIIFDGNIISTTLLSSIIQDLNILVDIVYANSWQIDNKVFGYILIRLPNYDNDIEKLKEYLSIRNIKFEEDSKNGIK